MMRALKFDKGMGRRGQQSHRKRRSMTGSYRSLCVYKGCGAATYVDDVGFGQARSEINPSARFFSKDVPSLRFSSRFMPFPRERTGDFQKLKPTLGPIEIENNWTLIENTAAVAWLVPVNGDRNGAPGVQSEGVEDRIEVDLYHLKGPWRTGAGGCLLECVATAADPEPASDDDDLPKRIGRMVLRMIMRARRWSTGCCPQVRPSHCN